MRSILRRRLGAGAVLVLALAGAACVQPPSPPQPPGDDLLITITGVSSSCNSTVCNGSVTFRVTNTTDDPSSGEPIPTVVPDTGTATRVLAASTCDDPPLPLDAGQSCVERYTLQADERPLTGTISVDAGDLEGDADYSA